MFAARPQRNLLNPPLLSHEICFPTLTHFQSNVSEDIFAPDKARTRYHIVFLELYRISIIDIPLNEGRFAEPRAAWGKSHRLQANVKIQPSVECIEEISECYMFTIAKTCYMVRSKVTVLVIKRTKNKLIRDVNVDIVSLFENGNGWIFRRKAPGRQQGMVTVTYMLQITQAVTVVTVTKFS